MESTSWPLPGPAVPPPAVAPGRRTVDNPDDDNNINSISNGDVSAFPPKKRRLSGPAKDASEDYHNFIEAVEKSTKQAVFSERRRTRRRAQHVPVGTTRLYDHGRVRLIPFPSANPKDPLNLPAWRKWAAIGAMSMFGAIAVATEAAVGNLLLPAFFLEYAGVDPRAIRQASFAPTSTASFSATNITSALDPLLPAGAALPPASQIDLLATVPLLTAAAAGYVQVPLSEAVGRRPVLLLASACAWAGALWAGLSSHSAAQSGAASSSAFSQHLAARALVGLGAGAVNALIPLVAAHDLVFLHQRHLALAVAFAVPAVVTAGFAAAAPVLAASADWRILYYIAAAAGFLAWLALVALVPETRWTLRTKTQLCGGGCGGDADTCVYADDNNLARRLDEGYGRRTLWTDVGVLAVSPFGAWQWARAAACVLDVLRTALLPAVLWVALLHAVLLVAYQAAAQLAVAAMLAQGVPFARTGFGMAVSLGAAGLLTVALGGVVGGRATLAVTRHLRAQQKEQQRRQSMLPPKTAAERSALRRRRPTVRREAEHNLPVLVLPLVLAVAGCFVFGVASYDVTAAATHWAVLAAAAGALALALLLALVAGSVFLVESYPVWAGPCLVHANGLRLVAAVFLSGRTASLVAGRGALSAWAVYAEVLIVTSLGLPALFFGGRRLRAWAAGTVQGGTAAQEEAVHEEAMMTASSSSSSASPTPSDAYTSTTSTSSSSRYTASPHPGTRADVPARHEAATDESSITGRAL